MNYVYVLKLQNDKWYVGYTENIKNRLKHHFTCSNSSASASWVLKYPPICVDLIIKGVTKNDEKFVTQLYMLDKGWENVRGAGWTGIHILTPLLFR